MVFVVGAVFGVWLVVTSFGRRAKPLPTAQVVDGAHSPFEPTRPRVRSGRLAIGIVLLLLGLAVVGAVIMLSIMSLRLRG